MHHVFRTAQNLARTGEVVDLSACWIHEKGANCWESRNLPRNRRSRGAKNVLVNGTDGIAAASAVACQKACRAFEACNAVAFDRANARCYLRRNVVLTQCSRNRGSRAFDLYIAPWVDWATLENVLPFPCEGQSARRHACRGAERWHRACTQCGAFSRQCSHSYMEWLQGELRGVTLCADAHCPAWWRAKEARWHRAYLRHERQRIVQHRTAPMSKGRFLPADWETTLRTTIMGTDEQHGWHALYSTAEHNCSRSSSLRRGVTK